MSDSEGQQTPAAAEIPAAAQLWDEVLQAREEQKQFRREFDEHRSRVKERHHALGEQLALVVQASEKNTYAREDYELEIKQLHSIMRQWYRSIIDTQRVLLLIAERLEVDQAIITLDPPLPLKSRALGAKEAA